MKKIYLLLVICVTMPFSTFAVNTDVVIKSGTDCMATQGQCGGI